jgi:hypothetical protein
MAAQAEQAIKTRGEGHGETRAGACRGSTITEEATNEGPGRPAREGAWRTVQGRRRLTTAHGIGCRRAYRDGQKAGKRYQRETKPERGGRPDLCLGPFGLRLGDRRLRAEPADGDMGAVLPMRPGELWVVPAEGADGGEVAADQRRLDPAEGLQAAHHTGATGAGPKRKARRL